MMPVQDFNDGDELTRDRIKSWVRAIKELQAAAIKGVQYPLAMSADRVLSATLKDAVRWGKAAYNWAEGDSIVFLHPCDQDGSHTNTNVTINAYTLCPTGTIPAGCTVAVGQVLAYLPISNDAGLLLDWSLVVPPTAFGQRLTCVDDGSGKKKLAWIDAQALSEIFTDDFNQKDGPLEKRWFNWNANAATVLDNSVRLAGWCEYIVNKCGYDAEIALDGSYTHRMCFNNYYVEGGKTGVDDFYLYCRVNKVGAGDYPRGVQLRMHLDSGTSTATCYLELCDDGPIKTIQQANVPWPTGWFNLRLEARGNSFQGYVNDTLYVQGITRYGSGEADPVAPPDDGTEDWYTVYTGKFIGWGVVPGTAGQHECADDYALFIYR